MIVKQDKTITDLIIATRDTILLLQEFLSMLETYHVSENNSNDFEVIFTALTEARLLDWLDNAGGHGLATLVNVLNIQNSPVMKTSRKKKVVSDSISSKS